MLVALFERLDVDFEETIRPYKFDSQGNHPMTRAGDGYNFHITGLVHDERGYPVMTAEQGKVVVTHLMEKINGNADKIVRLEEDQIEGADIVVVSYGITSRIAVKAIQDARNEGLKVGSLRLITIWPFCEKRIRELAGTGKAFVVPEINYGQMVLEVERCAGGKSAVISVNHCGGAVHDPEVILDAIRKASK